MKATLLKEPTGKMIERIVNFEGLNTFLPSMYIKKNQASDMRNVDSSKYPALKVRNGKTIASIMPTLTGTFGGLGQNNNNKLHWIDGTTWEYYSGAAYMTKIQTLTSSDEGFFREFSTGTTRYIIFSNGTDRFAWDGYTVAYALSQTGGDSTHVVLATTASAVDDYYNGCLVYIYSGTGAGQLRTISDYVGSSKTAEVSVAWTTTPDATSLYVIHIVTNLTNAPTSKIFAAHKGRMFWAKSDYITYSALNLINDYSGIGSGTINISNAKGSINAIAEFADRLWIFTQYNMLGLYGTGPDYYELVDVKGNVGTVSAKSIVVSGKQMYWLAYDGIYEFDGASYQKISEPYGANGVKGGCTSFIKSAMVSGYESNVCAGENGDCVYFSMPYGTTTENNITLMFDKQKRMWYVRSDGFVSFVTIDNILYGMDYDGVLWDMSTVATSDSGTAISWYWITGALNDASPSSKEVINEIWLTFKLPVGSTMQIGFSETDEGTSFTDSPYTFVPSASVQTQRVMFPSTSMQNTNCRRWKLYGTGDCTIYHFEEKGRVKSNHR
jgi:hypothetical protein